MPPDHHPCAIPTATCPQLCQLVPNLVAHNLSETRTLKDRKWCFFHGLRYANGQHNICQKHETFCPVRKTMIKTMMSTFDWKVVKGLLGVIKRLQTVGAIDAKRHATIEGETHESGGSSQATNMLLKTSMPWFFKYASMALLIFKQVHTYHRRATNVTVFEYSPFHYESMI